MISFVLFIIILSYIIYDNIYIIYNIFFLHRPVESCGGDVCGSQTLQ